MTRLFLLLVMLHASVALAQLPPRTPVEPEPTRPARYGANVPFKTYEAEATQRTVTNGSVVKMDYLPTRYQETPEMEASGRGYVELNATGEYLEFRKVRKATGMVIRHCIPDAPTGGGISATLNVYVNGTFRQTITLSSKYNWLYGAGDTDNGQSNDPAAGQPHHFWDDTRFVITGGLKAGDRIRFQKDAANTAAFYRIDCVDLELIPPPLVQPANSLSVTAYGANGSDNNSDSFAIRNCINAAKAQGKSVWIPPGIYRQGTKWDLDGVKVKGAGMWHTEIHGFNAGTDWTGRLGFTYLGNGPSVSDLYITSLVHDSRSIDGGKPFTGGTSSNWRIRNVWIDHTNVGCWLGGPGGIARNCRLYSTYADGLNINNGATNAVVVNNYLRGIGDDGVVILSQTVSGSNTYNKTLNITLRYNTVIANWWGANCSIGGGDGHVIEYNYLADNDQHSCLRINLPTAFLKYPLTNTIIRGNMVVRGGGNLAAQRRGAFWLNTSYTTAQADFYDNVILDPIFRGIHIVGVKPVDFTFTNTLVDNPGVEGIRIESDAAGSASFVTTNLLRMPSVPAALVNNGGADFTLTQTGTHTEVE